MDSILVFELSSFLIVVYSLMVSGKSNSVILSWTVRLELADDLQWKVLSIANSFYGAKSNLWIVIAN